jgi:ABC-type transport system involved in multi-copper enzyme maturation permease subunit
MGGMGTVSSQIIFEIDWDGETMSIICMSVVSIIFLIATWFVFKRKDLPI